MFEGDFYRIIDFTPTEEGYTAEVELRADHPVYQGHFPAQPVVPGVCTMRVVRELTARAVGCAIWFDTIREAKFVADCGGGYALRAAPACRGATGG